MKKLVVFLAASFLCAGIANASLIPFLANGPTSSGDAANPFQYNYSVTLSTDERLDPVATNGNSCSGAPCTPPGTFWTLYDVPGGAGGTSPAVAGTPVGWSSSIQFTGVTPGGIIPPDDGVVFNVTFNYDGPNVISGPQVFTGFLVNSTGDTTALGSFSFQATKNSPGGGSDGTTDNGKGNVLVPASSVPEPASMLLIGGGLVGLALFRRKFVR